MNTVARTMHLKTEIQSNLLQSSEEKTKLPQKATDLSCFLWRYNLQNMIYKYTCILATKHKTCYNLIY